MMEENRLLKGGDVAPDDLLHLVADHIMTQQYYVSFYLNIIKRFSGFSLNAKNVQISRCPDPEGIVLYRHFN